MGNNSSKNPSVGMESYITEGQKPAEKPKCKACCACPETKRVRDACIIENGQENCTKLIEEHKECMRKLGFNI